MDKGNFIDFSANVNPFAPNDDLMEMVKSTVSKREFYVSYPDTEYSRARESIAKNLGNGMNGDNIILANGSIELIKLFSEVFSKGEAIIPIPTFCEYERSCRMCDSDPIFIRRDGGFEENPLPGIKSTLTPMTSSLYICNPNNPTGALMKKETLRELAEFLDNEDVMVFVDEAFIDFAPNESVIDMLEDLNNIVVGRSLTKILGIPGIRLGYGIANKDTIEMLRNVQMPWSVNNLARDIAENISRFNAFITYTVDKLTIERGYMIDRLESSVPGIEILPSNANYIMMRIDGMSSQEISGQLRAKGFLVRRCDSFRGGDVKSVRIAIRDREDDDRLLEAMTDLFGS